MWQKRLLFPFSTNTAQSHAPRWGSLSRQSLKMNLCQSAANEYRNFFSIQSMGKIVRVFVVFLCVCVCVCVRMWNMCLGPLQSISCPISASLYPITKKVGSLCFRSSVCSFVYLFAFSFCAKDIFKSHNPTTSPSTTRIIY